MYRRIYQTGFGSRIIFLMIFFPGNCLQIQGHYIKQETEWQYIPAGMCNEGINHNNNPGYPSGIKKYLYTKSV